MENLLIVNQENQVATLDSREVADMIDVRHADLMRSIDNYVSVISHNAKLRCDEYFMESTYQAGTGKQYKCYKLTKQGCELVANKLTGEKGILFSAMYVKRFNEMQKPKSLAECLRDNVQLLVEQEKRIDKQEKRIDDLTTKNEEIKQIQDKQQSTLDTLNGVCINGTKRQKLKRLVDNYSIREGKKFGEGWNIFKVRYNTAYHTNLSAKITHYKKQNNLKKRPTIPEYFELTQQLDDALRVAEKL